MPSMSIVVGGQWRFLMALPNSLLFMKGFFISIINLLLLGVILAAGAATFVVS